MGPRTYSYWLEHQGITGHQATIDTSDARGCEGEGTNARVSNKQDATGSKVIGFQIKTGDGAVTLEKVQVSILCNSMAGRARPRRGSLLIAWAVGSALWLVLADTAHRGTAHRGILYLPLDLSRAGFGRTWCALPSAVGGGAARTNGWAAPDEAPVRRYAPHRPRHTAERPALTAPPSSPLRGRPSSTALSANPRVSRPCPRTESDPETSAGHTGRWLPVSLPRGARSRLIARSRTNQHYRGSHGRIL